MIREASKLALVGDTRDRTFRRAVTRTTAARWRARLSDGDARDCPFFSQCGTYRRMRTVILALIAGCGGNEASYQPLPVNDLSSFTTAPLPDGGGADQGTKPSPMPATGCGTCPSGTTCGSAGRIITSPLPRDLA